MTDKQNVIRESFLTAMFSLLGYVANCDGQINRSEIKRIRHYIKKMNLSEVEHQRALLLLKLGASDDFNASEALQKFLETTTPKLIQILLVYLVTVAKADGYLVEKELHAIQWIARKLKYKSIAFHHLLKMIYAQDQMASSRNSQAIDVAEQQNSYSPTQKVHSKNTTGTNDSSTSAAHQHQDLQKAYATLGVGSEMTDDEIRMAYKRLVSQFHPDKLAGQNLPSEQLSAAAEQFKKIQIAYAFIKKYRSIYVAN